MYGRLMRALARRAGMRLFRFFRRPLGSREGAGASAASLQLRSLSEPEVLALCGEPALDLEARKVRAAYARGGLCVAAFESGAIRGYCWIAFAPLHHLDGVWVEFDPRAAWLYKSFVLAPHRGRGIAALLYRFADAPCIEQRREYSILCVESHNGPSIAAARRAGYVDAGFAAHALRGGSLIAWRSPRAKSAAVRFYLPQLER